MIKLAFIALSVSFLAGTGRTQTPTKTNSVPQETLDQKDARLAWWRDARFGMFIHWGVYAVPAGIYQGKGNEGASEWLMNIDHIPVTEYKKFALRFNPVNYNPEEWVALAKEAGMRYIVITAKHHDGFALFKTAASKWNVVDASPYGKDLLRPLAEVCHKQGLPLGFYYSQAQDWVNGGAASHGKWDKAQDRDMDDYIDHVAIPQLRELLSNYGSGTPSLIWWDTPTDMTPQMAEKINAVVHQYDPSVILNSRLGAGYNGDFDTPEGFVPASNPKGRDWETCMTMNHSWGFNKNDSHWKSGKQLIQTLCEANSKGGNFLLNVGPKADGSIPEKARQALEEIGSWMKVNSASIYGTQAGPFPYRMPWGYSSRKANTLYLFVFDWPKNGRIFVPLKNNVTKAWQLSSPEIALTVKQASDSFVLQGPTEAPDKSVTVVAVKISGEPVLGDLPPPPKPPIVPQPADGTITLTSADAELVGAHIGNSGSNIGFWSSADSFPRWSLDVRQPGLFKVQLVYGVSSAQAGSEVELTTGRESFRFTVQPTKGWSDYQTVTVGTIRIADKGELTLSLKPLKLANEGVMNLRSIILQPIKDGN